MDRIRESEPEPEHACRNCKFAVMGNDPLHRDCRRRSPLVTGGMMSNVETVWPTVGPDDWCGDFEHSN